VDVSIDFNRESLEVRLRESGFVPGRLCLWVWEGVSMYLDEAAVRATLDLVRRLSAPGSLIACDVWCPPEGGLRQLTQRDLPALAFKLIYDEPLTWGVPRERLAALFRDHGLALIEDVPADELVARYQPRARGWLEVGTNMVFAVGEVER
jgi:methyltransferase (TIGR00027 family)